ncbi:Coatomer subunit alpha-2 [Hibiscus syriacus]|uniref:Coatomer subunit alpha-2 n=1 Tax=Hibiscus syriacus TaxID=106335 RepID=A0A6A3B3W0_HIBSY|nr:Coatomer subunit alpha-2 [Hibiscus syriacus]
MQFWATIYLISGHDSGIVVFKLERERPAFAVSGNSLFYAKDRFLRHYDFCTQRQTQVIPIRRPDVDGGSYELYVIPGDSIGRGDGFQEARKGPGSSALFIARNRFAVLDKGNNQVLIMQYFMLVQSGNIQIAVASAKEIDDKDHWYRLGVEALRQGNAGIVEYAYQRTKNFERLSFLYLITGSLEKLSKMLKIAEVKNDVMGQFHNALYLCDIRERVKILENAVHLPLAYVIASVHGLQDVADRLAAELGDYVPPFSEGKKPSFWMPPTTVVCSGDWPLLRVMKGIFEGGLDSIGRGGAHEEEEGAEAPTPGMPVSQIWTQKSSLAADHATAGNFDTAMRLLSRQLGIRNFAPLKSMFLDLHTGSHSYLRAFSSAPVAGYKATTAGKFTEALRLFLNILHIIPLIVVESRKEVDEVKELIIMAKEYVLGLQMELKRRQMNENPERQQELAAYFTHCNLQLPHLRLVLLNTMTVCYKARKLEYYS